MAELTQCSELPQELTDYITTLAGLPKLGKMPEYGEDITFCGTFTLEALNFRKKASDRTVWRQMRRVAAMPTLSAQMKRLHNVFDHRLHAIHLRPVYAPLHQEHQSFQVWKPVYPFIDGAGRCCLFYSPYGMGQGSDFKTWMDAYGLWCRVEHYSNSTDHMFSLSSNGNSHMPGWRCRSDVFILRLGP